MPLQKYLAELLGTFMLTLAVWLSIVFTVPLATPVAAALTLGLFVYTVGRISGAHLNPAVTCAMVSINKLKAQEAAYYIVAQVVGSLLAMVFGRVVTGETARITALSTLDIGLAEALGAFILAFGVAAVTYKRIDAAASGLVVGGSLLLGIYAASSMSNGVLNPAVAIGIGSVSPMYLLGPIVGAVLGAWAFRYLSEE